MNIINTINYLLKYPLLKLFNGDKKKVARSSIVILVIFVFSGIFLNGYYTIIPYFFYTIFCFHIFKDIIFKKRIIRLAKKKGYLIIKDNFCLLKFKGKEFLIKDDIIYLDIRVYNKKLFDYYHVFKSLEHEIVFTGESPYVHFKDKSIRQVKVSKFDNAYKYATRKNKITKIKNAKV